MTLCQEILKRWSQAETLRLTMASTWREISDYVRPIKQNIGTDQMLVDAPNQNRLACLFDTSAIDANRTYAAGCMSWMTPSETTWFSFDSPQYLQGEESVKSWYSQCTDITARVLAQTNFYSQIHEAYLDDGAFGTSGVLIEEDTSAGIRFEALQIGDYAILENANREVDTVFRKFNYTPRQAAQKFGENALHESVRKKLNPAGGLDAPDEYLHVIMPREDRDRSKSDPENMPWASIWIDLKNKVVIRESGVWEMPIPVHRHLLWSHLPYGFSPGMQALADCRQLNTMQQYLDTLVEKQVTPPILAPAGYEGSIDLRAGGVTFFKSQEESPRYWPNPANYLVGEDRVEFRRRQIDRAFHVELFQALSAVPPGKEMTAAEIHMRQRDRLTLFSPTFARKNSELNTPIMRRVFAILLRAGAFPKPPTALMQERDGFPFIPDPEIVYTSRLALQIKAIHNDSYLRVMEMVMPLVTVQPDALDHFDTDEIIRGLARNEGFKEEWLRDPRKVQEMRRMRMEQQEQARAEAMALEEAGAVADLKRAGVAA